ncbi:MAG: hypothetical protein AAGI08_08910 [Bacteroidota bacterium]
MRRILLFLLASPLYLAVGTDAQILPDTPPSVAVQVYSQSWDIESDGATSTIQQSVVPIGVYVPLADGLEARVSTSYVILSRREAGATSDDEVSGLSDLRLNLNYGRLLNGRLLLGLAIGLPTGKLELTGQEQDVVFDFVAPDLSVRANRFSEGFNLGLTANYAFMLSETLTLGLGAGLVGRGAYETGIPGIGEIVDLQPGSEATVTAALNYTSGPSFARFTTAVTGYGVEQINGVEAFQLGPRVQLQASFRRLFAGGAGAVMLDVQNLFQSTNSSLGSGGLVEDDFNANGNYLTLGLGAQYQITRRITLGGSGLGRIIGANGQDVGDSNVFEASGVLGVQVTPAAVIDLGVRLVQGSGTGFAGEERAISGVEAFARSVIRF